jgi:tetratricopeptide (TPR) repeat protein
LYGKAIERYERLAHDFPDRHHYVLMIAECLRQMAKIQTETGRPVEALATFERAIAMLKPLATVDQVDFMAELAQCHHNRGVELMRQTNLTDALADHQEALRIRKQVIARDQRPAYRRDLAGSLSSIGLVYLQREERVEAIRFMERACAMMRELVRQNSDDMDSPPRV